MNGGDHLSADIDAIGKVQQANLRVLESALRQHWHLGRNIFLSWCLHDQGIQVLVVPHYYLGNFSASLDDCAPVDRLDALNGRFIRGLISGNRELPIDDFQGAARRLELTPMVIPLPVSIGFDVAVHRAVDMLIKRYSISYVESRAVLLFDIVNFSLVSPFEQTSQLNSLSYSLNSAYSKLLKKNIEINFCRTTTGDGYYVWNEDTGPQANIDLFHFMVLVIANNAMARRHASSAGNVVPILRTGFHIGSHYEFYQTEGINPSMSSYIVGDVTIELARMVDLTEPGQILLGEFNTVVPTSASDSAYLIDADSQRFVERASRHMKLLRGVELSGGAIDIIHCYLTGETGASAGQVIKRFRVTDKHGRSRSVYNLRINIHIDKGRPLILGMQDARLPTQHQTGRRSLLQREKNTTTPARPETALAVDEE